MPGEPKLSAPRHTRAATKDSRAPRGTEAAIERRTPGTPRSTGAGRRHSAPSRRGSDRLPGRRERHVPPGATNRRGTLHHRCPARRADAARQQAAAHQLAEEHPRGPRGHKAECATPAKTRARVTRRDIAPYSGHTMSPPVQRRAYHTEATSRYTATRAHTGYLGTLMASAQPHVAAVESEASQQRASWDIRTHCTKLA